MQNSERCSGCSDVPGLKVVCPSGPHNAYGLLRDSISDPDPVIFVEHKALYALKAEVPDVLPASPLGQAATVRRGDKATVVSHGAAVGLALQAADIMAERDVSVEVIGVGAEIAARMADIGFDELDGPIVRVGAPFIPTPFAAALEQACRPSVEQVVAAIHKTMGKE